MVHEVIITGAFLAQSATTVDNLLNVIGGVITYVTLDPKDEQVRRLTLVLLTQTPTDDTQGHIEIKIRPPLDDADPLIIREPIPEQVVGSELGFIHIEIPTNIWRLYQGRWVIEASLGENTVSVPLHIHYAA